MAAFIVIALAGVFVQYRKMNKFTAQLYPGEEFEEYNSSSLPVFNSNSRIPRIVSQIFNCRKKVDDVPLLDVVSLEDY